MAPTASTACERCGRSVRGDTGCSRHPGSRLLDLRRADDRSWRDEVVAMRRRRHLRLVTAIAGTAAMVLSLVALSNLVASGTAAHIHGEVGMARALTWVLRGLTVGLVAAGVGWGGLGAGRSVRTLTRARDPIEWHAAARELVRRVTAIASAVLFAVSVVFLRDKLVGVPAELAAAAVALACVPPLQWLLDALVSGAPAAPAPQTLLPPQPVHALDDTRVDDPLEQTRRGALRRSIMQRR